MKRRRRKYKLREFRGQQMTLIEISEITGVSVSTLRRRASRGMPFDQPLHGIRVVRTLRERDLRLTGDRDRDLKAIITARHRDVIRRHKQSLACGQRF